MKKLLILIFCTLITGCASLRSFPNQVYDVDNELKTLSEYFSPDVIKTYNSKAGEVRRGYRDEVIDNRVRAINIVFNEFEKNIQIERKLGDIGTDWAVIALNSTGALVTPALTKSILSAVSGGIVGAKGSVDKNLFYDKTMPVLISQMESSRKEVLVRIRLGMTQDCDKYSLSNALIDLDDYFKAGTLQAAIIAINASSGDSMTTSGKELKRIVKGTYMQEQAGDLLLSYWKPDGKVNSENEKAIKEWMKINGIEEVSIPFFMRASQYSSQRNKAIRDLKLN